MRFARGETRYVVITKKYAFKIARIRPLWPFVRMIQHYFLGKKITVKLQQRLLTNDIAMVGKILYFFVPGIVANVVEYRNFKNCGEDNELVPTVFTFFGLVNVQHAGVPASRVEVEKHILFHKLGEHPLFEDITETHQYCVIDGKTLLADYAQNDLVPVLKMMN